MLSESIFVNEHKVEEINQEFIVGKDAINQFQEYSQAFTWGTLYVLNNVLVEKTEDLRMSIQYWIAS